MLNVTEAPIAAGLPVAVTPFLTMPASYKGFVNLPLNTGHSNCEDRSVMQDDRLVLLLVVCPLLSRLFPVNGGLATSYESALLPGQGNNFLD